VQTLVKQFVKAGGEYRVAAVKPPDASKALTSVELSDGTSVSAANYVFACGPWLPKVFSHLLGPRIFPTRQEVFFFSPPAGDALRMSTGCVARRRARGVAEVQASALPYSASRRAHAFSACGSL